MLIQGYTITPNNVSVVVDGRARLIDSSREGFAELPALLQRRKRALTGAGFTPTAWTAEDEFRLEKILDLRKHTVRITHGAVEICDDRALFKGMPIAIGGVLVERLIEHMNKGYDTEPLALFMTNLMANPTESARNELYLWLETSKLPITDDGHFLAWKAVRQDYKSHHDGFTDNRIGAKPFMQRDLVDPERSNTCSRGLHFCSYAYLPHFAKSDSRIMICKINPADVVSIPHDYNNAKGRAWTYEIIGEVPRDDVPEFFKTPVVSAEVNDIEQYDPSEWDAPDEDDEETTGLYDVPEAPVDVMTITQPKLDGARLPLPTYTVEVVDQNGDVLDKASGLTEVQATHVERVMDTVWGDKPTPPLELNKKTLRSLLKKYSQRRIAKDTGIPRTTLQELIYRFWPEKAKRPTKKD